MADLTRTERLLRHERLIVLAGLIAISALAWWWVVIGAGTGMNILAMSTWRFPPPIHAMIVADWSLSYAIAMFFMWWIMMIAMMTPSAAPMILLYARVHRNGGRRTEGPSAVAPTFAFAAGYLSAWAAFSLIAVVAQWTLEQSGLLHTMMMWSLSPVLSGSLLLAAGLYQLTPLKNVCLAHCRSPLHFLSHQFRPGPFGAVRMGWRHGLYCLGCCWLLMALLFAGGIMNLVWIAGLALFVLIEKVAPGGVWIARGAGAVMAGAGGWVLWTAARAAL